MPAYQVKSLISTIILYRIFAGIVCISVFLSVYLERPLLFIFPAFLIGFGAIIDDYRRIFYVIFSGLPFSSDFYFEGFRMLIVRKPAEDIAGKLDRLTRRDQRFDGMYCAGFNFLRYFVDADAVG